MLPNWLVYDVALPLRRKLTGDVYRSAERMRRHVERRAARPASHAPPRGLGAQRDDVGGWPVYTVSPVGEPRAEVVYFHGGAYVNQIVRQHWSLVAQLVREAGARCVVPIYPLVPHATAAEVVDSATRFARPGVVLMGDSAGGGLALAVALRAPAARLVLISPWVDAAVPYRDAPADTMLRRPGLAEAGRLYADGLSLDDPRVSPLHGDLSGLPPTTIFTGTRDLLDPDSRRLADAARAAGVEVDLHVCEGTPHVYPLLPTRDGAEARRRIITLL
jgi:epsilon-lactone hydrolase